MSDPISLRLPDKAVETILVLAYEVGAYSNRGWKLVAVIPNQVVETTCVNQEHLGPDSYSTISCNGSVAHVVESPLFLMVRDEMHATQAKRLREAHEALSEQKANVKALEEKVKAKDDARLEAVRLQDWHNNRHETADKHLREARETLRKYETDMGKIQEALGTKQIDEILGR